MTRTSMQVGGLPPTSPPKCTADAYNLFEVCKFTAIRQNEARVAGCSCRPRIAQLAPMNEGPQPTKESIVRVFMILCLTIVAAAHSAIAEAQIYKCKSLSGTIEYSQTPCSNQIAPALPISTAPAPEPELRGGARAPAGNAYERQLSAMIAEAIAVGDFSRASRLAVTDEHRRMVSSAQQAALEEKRLRDQERRARRPVFCSSNGYQMGGSYSGTTICR